MHAYFFTSSPAMLLQGLHKPAVLSIPSGKSPVRSDQVNLEATLRNRHTQLRIPGRVTASQAMPCYRVPRYIETKDCYDLTTVNSSGKSGITCSSN